MDQWNQFLILSWLHSLFAREEIYSIKYSVCLPETILQLHFKLRNNPMKCVIVKRKKKVLETTTIAIKETKDSLLLFDEVKPQFLVFNFIYRMYMNVCMCQCGWYVIVITATSITSGSMTKESWSLWCFHTSFGNTNLVIVIRIDHSFNDMQTPSILQMMGGTKSIMVISESTKEYCVKFWCCFHIKWI